MLTGWLKEGPPAGVDRRAGRVLPWSNEKLASSLTAVWNRCALQIPTWGLLHARHEGTVRKAGPSPHRAKKQTPEFKPTSAG